MTPTTVVELQSRIEELERELADKYEAYKRALADAETLSQINEELRQQLSTARADEREAIKEIVQGWLEAYPEDIFIPPTTEQIQIAQNALQAVGMSVDKFGADMARHMATRLLEQIEEAAAIRNLE